MREIRFRGKDILNGEWIKGYLFYDYNDADEYRPFITYKSEAFLGGVNKQQIDEGTIGQFTGLYDKNRKEIYEGDILQQVHYVFSNDEYDHKGFKKFIIQVLWGQKEAAFIFKVIKEIDIEMPKDYKEPYREVIGNIYENVDLLKGADNIE